MNLILNLVTTDQYHNLMPMINLYWMMRSRVTLALKDDWKLKDACAKGIATKA